MNPEQERNANLIKDFMEFLESKDCYVSTEFGDDLSKGTVNGLIEEFVKL